jgi:antitoxin (DNA-binding transcriptional repressor) of toxin-antitoxin stability system
MAGISASEGGAGMLRSHPSDAVAQVAPCGYISAMKTAGVRELRNRLSEYLREVKGGETVLVTDRGEVIAELRPPGANAEAEVPPDELGLRRMIAEGRVRPPTNPDAPWPPPPVVTPLTADEFSALLDEDREEREI